MAKQQVQAQAVSKTDKILVIVESPNKVKTISGILKKAGYTKATVMASVGHIMQLADDRKSFKNSGVYPENNFDLNLRVSSDKHDVVEKLKLQASSCDYIFLASDPDREGEVIS